MIDTNRGGENNVFWKILGSCTAFPDDRTGKNFGTADVFKTDKVLVIESLSDISTAAMKMQTGNKPMAAPQDI